MSEQQTDKQRRTALITGASSGIGRELARRFARDGHGLVLVARREAELRELAAELGRAHGVRVTVVARDLARPEAPDEVFGAVQAAGIGVDFLVNNAGFGVYGPFLTSDLRRQLDSIQVNAAALTHLTGLFLPGMASRRWGRILNVASTAAFQPGPLMAVYYASKAYVLSFSEALADELSGSGVRVTALCPGPTRSGFQAEAKMEISRLFQGNLLLGGAMDPADVAEAGYRGMLRGETIVIPGARNALVANAVRFLPRKVVTRIARKAQESVGPG